jgi:ABC-type polysaccharide/polyol phosphate export permease
MGSQVPQNLSLESQTTTETPKADSISLLAIYEAIAAILAIRLFLLLAIVGAFVLGVMTVKSEDDHSLWTLAIYCAFTIIPLVFLDRKERSK